MNQSYFSLLNKIYFGQKIIHYFTIGILVSFFISCSLNARSNNKPIKNYFKGSEEEIHFGRLSPIDFKFRSSSCTSTYNCTHNLFDSNRSTEWISKVSSEPEWVLVDFSSKRLMNRLEWEISENSAKIEEFQIQVLFHEEWQTIRTIASPPGIGSVNFGNIDASTLRIYFPKSKESQFSLKNLRILLNNSILTGIPQRLTGYTLPIPNVLIPEDEYSLPGAPRKYRNGIHKGLDLFQVINKEGNISVMNFNTPAVAINDGEIVRADIDYSPMTLRDFTEISEYNKSHPVTYVNKDFGGRQIWIDHKNGVMSSYNHLSTISSHIKVGTKVRKGEIIGKVGNSGLKGEANGTAEQIHLHIEIWIDGEFLGNDMKLSEMKKFLQYFFSE